MHTALTPHTSAHTPIGGLRQAAKTCANLLTLRPSNDGISHVSIHFGYAETTDVPAVLARLNTDQTEGPINLAEATYFLSKIELRPGTAAGMARWRKRLFIATSHITADAAEQFRLPRDRVIFIGSHVEV